MDAKKITTPTLDKVGNNKRDEILNEAAKLFREKDSDGIPCRILPKK